MSSDIVAKQHLSHLPCPAVECIQRYFWNDQGTHGPDVRRHVLPLVCKQWKRCLELAPDAWTEVRNKFYFQTNLRKRSISEE